MQSIGFARQIMQQHAAHFERFIKARQRMDSVGHILDPSLYRDVINSRSLAQQVELVQAAMTFLRAIEKVAAEVVAS
ncbi:hypothetical protein [Bradyrhizobium sp. SZCCHNRI2049]|uniref:hypothetical protein n=1 Tax=Bradyrhizobium sp. SZCCHNRI2049 TaxID=3057287 RepID=UPI002915FF50|nr:hypothetical protein [Bradyrhizobium sp. SZCCHNRI2049]